MAVRWKLKEDKMTSQERHDALLSGKSVDRVGLYPFARGFCAKNTGISLVDFYTNAKKSFEAQLWTWQMYGHDETFKYGLAAFGAWEFGAEMQMPEGEFDQVPKPLNPPVQSEEDVAKLEMPDIANSGMTPSIMEFSKLLEKIEEMTLPFQP